MKTCKICGQEKTLDEFYKLSKSRSHRGDGHDTRCKECAKNLLETDEQRARNRIRDKQRQHDPRRIEAQHRYSQTEHGKIVRNRAQKKYHKTEYGKIKGRERCKKFQQTEKYKKAVERYRSKCPEKRVANIAVMNAIHYGKIERPSTCSVCGKPCVPHGHHYDYSKPLSVIWMCHTCHVAVHWSSVVP